MRLSAWLLAAILALLPATVQAAATGSITSGTASTTAAANTGGLTLSLNCPGQPYVTGVVTLSSAGAEVYLQVSQDNSTWRNHTLVAAGTLGATPAVVNVTSGMPYVRLRSTTPGVAIGYELSCK